MTQLVPETKGPVGTGMHQPDQRVCWRGRQQEQQQQQQQTEVSTAQDGSGTMSVADRMAVLRMRDARDGQSAFAAQKEPTERGQSHAAENRRADHAEHWHARLMEAMAHEQQQTSEHGSVADAAVDITDEGWLPNLMLFSWRRRLLCSRSQRHYSVCAGLQTQAFRNLTGSSAACLT